MSGTSPLLGLPQPLKVVVIGAGQAGLAAAYFLRARGLNVGSDFVVLDGNDGPGGAWRDRWDSLTLGGAHRIHPLPGMDLPSSAPEEPARHFVTRYYQRYEKAFELGIRRPVRVHTVHSVRFEGEPAFRVHTSFGTLITRAIINATGTWNRPFIPHYPGVEKFRGARLHTRNYRDAEDFKNRRVLVVGGGTSAAQFVQELGGAGAETVWTTRGVPRWTSTNFDDEWGADVERRVAERTTQGLRPVSVVATTGIPLVERYIPDIRSGLLVSRGSIVRFNEHSVILDGPGPDGSQAPSQGEADPIMAEGGTSAVRQLPGHGCRNEPSRWETPIDAILWATGFRHDHGHLAPLKLRRRGGGILLDADDVTALEMPGLYFTGYGASASTFGAARAGRRAALKAVRYVEAAG